MKIAEALAKRISGDVHDDEETRDVFSEDTSLFKVTPAVVVQPKSVRDVCEVVRYVREQKEAGEDIAVSGRSGGTCMSGGSLTEGVVIDFKKHMHALHEFDVARRYAVVEPGMAFKDFHETTLSKGLLMPSYPASWRICAVGGMVGNNAGGEKTFVYGKTENFVEELGVVFSDGNEYTVRPLSKSELEAKMAQGDFEGDLYKNLYELITANQEKIMAAKPDVTKNSAGYFLWNVWDGETFDMTKLLVGSQGTLGITTRVRFRLVPEKKISKLFVVFMNDLSQLGDMIVALKKFKPETMESYDDKTLKLAIRFAPDMIRLMKPKSLLAMGWHLLPEFFMILRNLRLPKLVIMAEFTGDDEHEVLRKMREAKKSFDAEFPSVQTRITASDDERDQFFLIRRQSFGLLREKVRGRHTAPFIDDFALQPKYLPEFLPKLNAILDEYPSLIFTIAGHPGDGNFHIIPLMDLKDADQRAIIPELSKRVYDLVLEYKGTITAEHNDGIVRTPFLEQMYGAEIIALFEKTKDIFDPRNIFNPGKKVRYTKGYLESHIKKDFS